MYIFKSNTSDGLDEKLSKPSTGVLAPLADASSARILLAPVVSPQTAALAGSSASSAPALTRIIDSIVTAGVVSNIAVPLTSEYAPQAANEDLVNSLAGALEAFTKNALNNVGEINFAPVPITSLSDSYDVQTLNVASTQNELQIPASNTSLTLLSTPQAITEVYEAPSVSAPVLITALTDSDITVLSSAKEDTRVNDVMQQAVVQNYINTGTGVLTVTTPGTQLSSLTLTGNVAFTASAIEVTSGITVSALSDSSDVTLYLVGGASAKKGSTDAITLGDGNNFVLDAGDGQVLFNFGGGTNVVMLTGAGVNGAINFANHSDTVGDFVVIASNGVDSAQALASNPLVTISGLNNHAHSLDTITFLGDMGASLIWAGNGSHGANDAQVMTVTGDASSLVNWVGAAQSLANNAHSVAWFQFDGNTYVLETALGNNGNHMGDTLVRLTGLTQFTGSNGELAFGALHLAG